MFLVIVLQQSVQFIKNESSFPLLEVIKLLEDEFKQIQESLASYETVKKFILLAEPLTIEKGELTPSLKIKRKVVEKNYKVQIDALYA